MPAAAETAAFDRACAALGREAAEWVCADSALRCLAACGIELAGCAAGWTAVVGDRRVTTPRFHQTLDRALAVLRGRRDLWARAFSGIDPL